MVYLLLLSFSSPPPNHHRPLLFFVLLHLGANPALYSRKLMHYAQVELDRIKTNVRPQQLQAKPDPIQVLESAYHMTTLDAQNEVKLESRRDNVGKKVIHRCPSYRA